MLYTHLVSWQGVNGWGVARRDDDTSDPRLVQNRLHLRLNALAAEGWEVISTAATENILTVILAKRVK